MSSIYMDISLNYYKQQQQSSIQFIQNIRIRLKLLNHLDERLNNNHMVIGIYIIQCVHFGSF